MLTPKTIRQSVFMLMRVKPLHTLRFTQECDLLRAASRPGRPARVRARRAARARAARAHATALRGGERGALG